MDQKIVLLCNRCCKTLRRVFTHPQTAAHSCKRPPWSSLWRPDHEDMTPARCHRRCPCTQAGNNRKNVNTCTRTCANKTSQIPNTHPHPTNTDTSHLSVYVLSSTDSGNWGGMSAVQARPCLCWNNLSETPLIWWLMTVCVSPPSPLFSIFSQQQIFIWWFTRGLCSPGCQQPRSFSAASRWFPGCTLPRFPPVEAAKHCDHTLSSVQRTTSG